MPNHLEVQGKGDVKIKPKTEKTYDLCTGEDYTNTQINSLPHIIRHCLQFPPITLSPDIISSLLLS